MRRVCGYMIVIVVGLLLVNCGGGGGESMSVTTSYTIAADADQFGYNRQRKDPLSNSIWKIEVAPYLGFGCFESFQSRDKWRMLLRYAIDIPDGSVISNAYITFVTEGAYNAKAFNALIYLADYDSGGDLDDLWPGGGFRFEEELSLIDMATDPVPVTYPLPAEAWIVDQEYTSSDIATLVQGFIDRPGYSAGNYIGLIIHEGDADDGAAGNHLSPDEDAMRRAQDEAGILPVLTVTYELLCTVWIDMEWAVGPLAGTLIGEEEGSVEIDSISPHWSTDEDTAVFARGSTIPVFYTDADGRASFDAAKGSKLRLKVTRPGAIDRLVMIVPDQDSYYIPLAGAER